MVAVYSPRLWIPHKHWGEGLFQWQEEVLAGTERVDAEWKAIQGKYQQNVWTLARWGAQIRCPENYTRLDWTTFGMGVPSDEWTPEDAEMLYLAAERWARLVCNPLNVPYKRWGFETPVNPQKEVANWRSVEDWSLHIDDCCTGGGGGSES